MNNTVYVPRKKVLTRWHMSSSQEIRLRAAGITPKPIKMGLRKLVYRQEDVERYEAERLVAASNS